MPALHTRIEATEALGHVGDCLFGGVSVADIELHDLGFAAVALDDVGDLTGCRFVAHVVDDDVGAALRQGQ
jgi:hypothetical protein